MARLGGYVVLEVYPSSSGRGSYEVRRGGDGVLYCMCMGWKMNKESPKKCKHTRDYVVCHPGTSYGPGYTAAGFANVAAVGNAWATVEKKSKKPVVVPSAPVATVAAPANWRALLLAERAEAEKRGVVTPPDALRAWAKDLDLED